MHVLSKPVVAALALLPSSYASPYMYARPARYVVNELAVRQDNTTLPEEAPPQDPATVDSHAKGCGLGAFDPKSWAESGGEKLLAEWIDKNGPGDWLQKLSKEKLGPDTITIDCSHTSSNNCNAPQGAADCDNYEYYFVRVMASQINGAFKSLQDNLQVQTIKDGLKVDKIITDFDEVMKDPPENTFVNDMYNIAAVPAVISAVVGAIPGGAVASGVFAVISAGIGAAGRNIKQHKPEPPKYEDLASSMNDFLGSYFSETQKILEKTLLAIFGDDTLSEEDRNKVLKEMIADMSDLGVQDIHGDAKNPISELLKGGEWLAQVQKSKIDDAMSKAFEKVRHGLIGNLLNINQVYVEQELPAYREGEVQACTALGTLKDGNSCLVIKSRDFEGGKNGIDAKPLDEKYLKKLGEYGVDLHTLIRNVVDCNNGKADEETIITDGSYPKCFFGMKFAKRIHKKDYDFQRGVNPYECVSMYKDQKDVPEWIRTYNKRTCDYEIPNWKPCKVNFEETSYWTEGGLDRYRMGLVGEDIDMAPVCPYALDGGRCDFASNRQCYYNEDEKKYVIDINFPKGEHGHGKYKACRDNIRSKYASDNRCEHN